jgi:hypothetical protein
MLPSDAPERGCSAMGLSDAADKCCLPGPSDGAERRFRVMPSDGASRRCRPMLPTDAERHCGATLRERITRVRAVLGVYSTVAELERDRPILQSHEAMWRGRIRLRSIAFASMGRLGRLSNGHGAPTL